jgi:hypothetical protein
MITVGTIGHFGHGKTTLTRALMEVSKAQGRHSSGRLVDFEINRNLPPGPRRPYSEEPEITILPADEIKEPIGWVIYEEVGVVVVNDYSVSHILKND